MDKSKLKHFEVVITRPGEIGEDLSRQLNSVGLTSTHLPTLKIIAEPMELPIEDFEIASNNDGKVFLTLRQPLIESFHAINNARNNKTSKEITLESVKEPTWKDALPFGLIFLGGGLSSKGILRSDSVTTAVGLISIVAGWILKTKENNKNIS